MHKHEFQAKVMTLLRRPTCLTIPIKIIEIAGSSTESYEQAIRNALATASKSLKNINWFEVKEHRGHVEDGAVAHHQVVLKVGFRLED